jgi:hypothetical protein
LNTDWVYYIYFDPFSFVPIYVGAGQIDRPWHHLKLARSERTIKSAFIARLRAGLAMGFEPPIVVIYGLTAGEALWAETTLIKAIGRRIDGTGPLYNIMPGWGLSPRPRRARNAVSAAAEITLSLRKVDPTRVCVLRHQKVRA